MSGRAVPHNLDVEAALLGAILLSRDARLAAVDVEFVVDEFH